MGRVRSPWPGETLPGTTTRARVRVQAAESLGMATTSATRPNEVKVYGLFVTDHLPNRETGAGR